MDHDQTPAPGRVSRRTLLAASAGAVAAAGAVAPAGARATTPGTTIQGAPRLNASTGASPLTRRVARALATQVVPVDDPAFLALFRETTAQAARVLETKQDVLLTHAEAIMGLEAAFRSLTRPGMTALSLVSGPYGAGQSAWLRQYGATVIEVTVPSDQAIDPEAVRAALAANPGIELVTMIHVETPSGTKNPIEAICPIVKAAGAVSLVDAASSWGGMPIYPDRWGADLVVGASQKSPGGPTGIGIISVSEAAWALMEANPQAPRGSFLSLLDWKERWIGQGVLPPGASSTLVYGLKAALDQLLARGTRESFARHALAARAFRAGAVAMGLELWAADESIAAETVTALRLPAGLTTPQVRAHLRERHSLALAGSVFSGTPAGATIRVGHMGEQTRPGFVLALLRALGTGLAELGVALDVPAGQRAARRVLG